MIYRALADAILVVHLAFIVFVVVGGFLLRRYPWLVWCHVPAAIWGSYVELRGEICPLTPLENHLRTLGGEAGYGTSFVEHYLLPLIYPDALTRNVQVAIGLTVLAINVVAYTRWVLGRSRHG